MQTNTHNDVHISSLVVHARPEALDTIKAQINAHEGAEVYADSPEGKIVVVLEVEQQGFITDIIEKINDLPDVLSTTMVYHQIDSNLDD